MQTIKIENQRASLQIFDSEVSKLPENWNVEFPVADGYLCIPTQPDHKGGVTLDVCSDTDTTDEKLKLRYKGKILCASGTLVVGTGLPEDVTEVEFDKPGEKLVEVWTDRIEEPSHIAIKITD